ncbi:universal stress protein [Halosolutus gelatinilyticus]|uniref:universal stress protein n=1 Tax=Halosolutus gelatinilyticus TaxID=2931975 RepID=UPI001FF5A8FE|nr:universal stress protein [Halosolutus gelatinilyticus]
MHVLVPIDGSSQSRAALDYALSQYEGETITTLHVVDPMEGVYSDYGGGGIYDEEAFQRAIERGESIGEQARDRAEDAGILDATTLNTVVETGQSARAIIDYADANDVDHIVMGSHGRSGVARVLLGSVAETVTRRSPVPVTIVR